MEGKEVIIKELFELIKQDPRHHNILQIFGKEIHREACDGYKAGFISTNADYDPKKFETYMKQIEVLDDSTQKAVKKMLKVFIHT